MVNAPSPIAFNVEFVRMVATAANERSTAEKKSTLAPEHIIAALKELEFDFMAPHMEEFLKEWDLKKKGKLV